MRLRLDYTNQEEKEKLLQAIGEYFKVIRISKDYKRKDDSKRRLHIEIEV